jgi:mannose-6-phosphate isomerase-like protein (cupin superfamily)
MPKLNVLHRAEFPGESYYPEVSPDTHPGLEMAYVLEGGATLMVDGRPDQTMAPGDWFQVPAGVPLSVQNGSKPPRALATYVVEKDKPLATFFKAAATMISASVLMAFAGLCLSARLD